MTESNHHQRLNRRARRLGCRVATSQTTELRYKLLDAASGAIISEWLTLHDIEQDLNRIARVRPRALA